MKTCYSRLIFCFLLCTNLQAQNWKPVGGKITTPWAEKLNSANPLPEYPRPQLVRKDWTNLNGLWQYSILPKDQQAIPAGSQGSILVPFAVESALSGVGKTVGKDSILWYKKTISVPDSKNRNVIL
ncbi:MAG TPA: hypothetical protein VKA49_15290, partial [Flavitalea sp.]|nr:hypothetical protein [Flavitalea sp.]